MGHVSFWRSMLCARGDWLLLQARGQEKMSAYSARVVVFIVSQSTRMPCMACSWCIQA